MVVILAIAVTVRLYNLFRTVIFTFDPLTPNVRKAICDRLSMHFHKADLKHENIGEKLFNRNPKVKRILAVGIVFSGGCLWQLLGGKLVIYILGN